MKLLTVLGLTGDDGKPSLAGDLRRGVAGFWPRIGLSIASAAVLIGIMLLCLGIVEQGTQRIRDEHVAAGMAVAGVLWCISLVILWWTYRRFARALRTAFVVVGIWAMTIPLCVMIEAMTRNELFIAGTLFLATALSITVIAGSVYGGTRGRPVMTKTGMVRVNCEQCGYSMVGLSSTTCPECGNTPTIDQLIAAQDYAMMPELPASAQSGGSVTHPGDVAIDIVPAPALPQALAPETDNDKGDLATA